MTLIETVVIAGFFVGGIAVGVVLREKELLSCEDIRAGGRFLVRTFKNEPRRIVKPKPLNAVPKPV